MATNVTAVLPKGTRVRLVTQGSTTPSGMTMRMGDKVEVGTLAYRLNPADEHARAEVIPDDAPDIRCGISFRRAAAAPMPYGLFVEGEGGG